MEQKVFASIVYSASCQDCGAQSECRGVQSLVKGVLRWDTESMCRSCGFAVAACGGELPAELRVRLLSERGPARLQVDPSARTAVVMRVLRAGLGLDLARVRSVLDEVATGAYSGTLPEMELLAGKLREAGIDAVAVQS
jgi:hypothetical protein